MNATKSIVQHAATICAKYLMRRHTDYADILALCESEQWLKNHQTASKLANAVLYSEGIAGSKIRRREVQFSQCPDFEPTNITAIASSTRTAIASSTRSDAETDAEAVVCAKIRAILGSEFSEAVALGYSLRDCADLGAVSSAWSGHRLIEKCRSALCGEFE